MNKEREALKLALEAFEERGILWKMDKAHAAIKEALAQPEQEPVAYIHRNEYNEYRLEPHDNFDIKSIPFNVDVLLFKTPQRTWVGLTDEDLEHIKLLTFEKEINAEGEEQEAVNLDQLIRAAEQLCKEKNCG